MTRDSSGEIELNILNLSQQYRSAECNRQTTLYGYANSRVKGFTLLEVMVAITVLGLVMVIAFASLRLGNRSWDAGLARVSETSDLRTVPLFLRQKIGQTLPIKRSRKEKRSPIAWIGKSDRLYMVTPALHYPSNAGLYEFLLILERDPGEDKARLMLYYEPYLPESEEFSVSQRSPSVVLVDGLRSLEFGYFGAPDLVNAREWHREWDEEATLYPEFIRLRMEFVKPGRSWPELLLPLRARQVKA